MIVDIEAHKLPNLSRTRIIRQNRRHVKLASYPCPVIGWWKYISHELSTTYNDKKDIQGES